jgi:hypothetical protein
MSRLRFAWGSVLIAFLATGPTHAKEPTQESIEEILAAPLPDDAYSDSQRCLMLHQYQSVQVLSEDLVVFEGRRTYWLNQLHSRCLGLRPDLVLKLSLRSSQVCELDTFRGLDSTTIAPLFGSGTCFLGRFEPISKEQLNQLRSALRMRKSSPAVDRTEQAEKEAGHASPG